MRYVRRSAYKLLNTKGLLLLASLLSGSLLPGQPVLTWHNDAARTGQNLQETLLSPTTVNFTGFGLAFTLPVDGKVDAQPLYVPSLSIAGGTHNVLYVATEHGTLYAFDADATGAALWSVSLLMGEAPSDSDNGCNQVGPEVGITSTPAIDLASGTIYAVAMSKDGSGNYHHRLHALDLVTHVEKFGGPVEITATYPGTGDNSSGGNVAFDPKQYKERAALLLSNGRVYTAWASNCDIPPYTAWIIGYSASTLARASVLNLTPNGSEGSIWQAGAGPAADTGGNLYFLMANGTFDTTLNAAGFPSQGDYGNAFMSLSTLTGLTVADYFATYNTVTESAGDQDLGSGGAILLPTLTDASSKPVALAVGAGKDGNAYVVDRNNMGKYNGSSNAIYQQFALGGQVFSSPAWFKNTLYYGTVGQQLAAYPYSGGSFGLASSMSSASFGYPGTTPSISANGVDNGIVWAVQNASPAVLYAFDAANLSTELYDSTQATANRDMITGGVKFTTPTVANGKVYVGTTTSVAVFGLLNCSYSGPPTGISVGAGAISGNVGVITAPLTGCPWSAASGSDFITITGIDNGGGVAYYSVAANSGPQRVGTMMIAGKTVTVTQAANTSPTSGLGFYPLTPCRIADTRSFGGKSGAFGPPFIAGGTVRNIPVPASLCNAPSNAQAYSLNIAVVPHTTLAFLTVWPTGSSFPTVSTLNSLDGHVVANAAIVPAGTDAAISFYASDDADVFVDINGYFAPPDAPQALAFYPVPPCRIADTRSFGGKTGPFGPPQMTAGEARDFPVTSSSCNIPSSAQAYSLNMTVSPATTLSYLTTWPTGGTFPFVSTLNDYNGGLLANAAIVPAGTSGDIEVYVTDATDLIIDIDGYFAPPGNVGALFFYPLTPCRVADTRSYGGKTDQFGPPSISGGSAREFPMFSSSCDIPPAAKAYSLNMTAWPPGPLAFLTMWPTGEAFPTVSTLNSPTGRVVANAAIVPAGTSGDIKVYVSSTTDVFFDINGYFAP